MNRQSLAFAGIGLGVVALLVAGGLYLNRGSHIELRGEIQKVRVQPMDENSAVVVIDFRFVNPANYPFVVRTVETWLKTESGEDLKGMQVSELDARRIFQYYPLLGPKYNESLVLRDKISPRQSLDRMVAARFELTETKIEVRKGLRIRVEEVDGAISEIVEERP